MYRLPREVPVVLLIQDCHPDHVDPSVLSHRLVLHHRLDQAVLILLVVRDHRVGQLVRWVQLPPVCPQSRVYQARKV